MQFSSAQQRGVDSEGHTLIVACAGAGKTAVLTKKAAKQLAIGNFVGVVTFTRKAAGEIEKRILKEVGESYRKKLIVNTFHSFCLRQLSMMGASGQLMPSSEQQVLVKRAWSLANNSIAPEEYLDSVEKGEITFADSDSFQAYERYLRLLEQYGATDINQVIKNCTNKLREKPEKAIPLDIFLIDEFQDCDAVQLDLIEQYAKAGAAVSCVGDDDQSIYLFRRALGFKAFSKFIKQYNPNIITLDTNYRCHAEIISSAETLILNNTERMPKQLKSHVGAGGSVECRIFKNREEECNAIADAVSKNPDDWMVLSRSNPKLIEINETLSAYRIKTNMKQKSDFWEKEEPGLLLSLLTFACKRNPLNLNPLLDRLGIDHHDAEQYTQFRLKNLSGDLPFEIVRKWNKFTIKTTLHMESVIRKGIILAKAKKTMDCINLYCEYISEVVRNDNLLNGDDTNKRISRLLTAAMSLSKRKGTLPQVLASLLLKNTSESNGGVDLLTMHGSKGLEKKNVWVAACEEGVTPNAKLTISIDEERRLFYVAMTRAETRLVTSSVEEKGATPSRFLIESGLLVSAEEELKENVI